jgi:hypothetical protein
MTFTEQQHRPAPLGSPDGDGVGDHDQPYRFAWWPGASVSPAPLQRGYPVNSRQYARLLLFRSRLQDHMAGEVEAGGSPRSAALHGVDALAAAALRSYRRASIKGPRPASGGTNG